MPVISLAQARSSGATTAALALARRWPRPVVVVEADPAGGDLAARYGVATSPGLVDLAAMPGTHPATLHSVAQNLGGVDVVAAPVGAEVVLGALDALGPGADWIERTEAGVDVLVDCGRLPLPPTGVPTLLEVAHLPVFLARPTAPSVVSLRQRLGSVPESIKRHAVIVLVGDRPYPADEIAATIGLPVLGVLADDPVAAAALGSAEPVRMGHSALLRSAEVLAEAMVARCARENARTLATVAESSRRWSAVTPRARFSFSQNGTR